MDEYVSPGRFRRRFVFDITPSPGPKRVVPHAFWPTVAWQGRDQLVSADDYVYSFSAVRRKGGIYPIARWKRLTTDRQTGIACSPDGRIIAISVQGEKRGVPGEYDPEIPYLDDSGRGSDLYTYDVHQGRARYLGTGSRPVFSPSGHTLLCVDRMADAFGLQAVAYDLKSGRRREVTRGVLGACFATDREVVVLRPTGALEATSLAGTRRQVLAPAAALFAALRLPMGAQLRKADLSW